MGSWGAQSFSVPTANQELIFQEQNLWVRTGGGLPENPPESGSEANMEARHPASTTDTWQFWLMMPKRQSGL